MPVSHSFLSGPARRRDRVRDALAAVRLENLWEAWTSAELDCDEALDAWFAAKSADRPSRHAAYLAALDREAQAAAVLQTRLASL